MADKSQKLWSNVFIATDEGKKLFSSHFSILTILHLFLDMYVWLVITLSYFFPLLFWNVTFVYFLFESILSYKKYCLEKVYPRLFFAFNIYCITRLKYNTFIQNTNWRIYKGIYILILPVGGKFQNNYTFSISKIVTHQKRMYILDNNVPGRFSDKMRKNMAS